MTQLKFQAYTLSLGAEARKLRYVWTAYIGAVVAIIVIIIAITHEPVWIFTLLICGFGILYLPPVHNRMTTLHASAAAMQVFAKDNNMRFVAAAKPNYNQHFQAAASRLGSVELHEQIVKGELDGHPFETYIHTFRRPFGKQYSRSAVRVYRIQLPRELPHIFIRNRQLGAKLISIVPRHFDDDQRVDLEGNFHKRFTTYTHRRTVTKL